MKSLTTYITEKMIHTKDNSKQVYDYHPETNEELKDIIEKLVDEQSMEDIINLNSIDTSKITDMSDLFEDMEGLIKIDMSGWDVSKVEDMGSMFKGCINLEKIIGIEDWDVSNVTNMLEMFKGCEKFNCDLSNWNISKAEDIRYMFNRCYEFNQPLNDWDVSNINYKGEIFRNCPIEEKYKPKFK